MTHTVKDRCPQLLSLRGDFASFCLILILYRWLSRVKYRELHGLVTQDKKKLLERVRDNFLVSERFELLSEQNCFT